MLVMGIGKMQSAGGDLGDKFKEEMEKAATEMHHDVDAAIDTAQANH